MMAWVILPTVDTETNVDVSWGNNIKNDLEYLRDQDIILTAASAMLPASSAAEQVLRTNLGTCPQYVLKFDKDVDENAFWSFVMPRLTDAATLYVDIYWFANTATSGAALFDVGLVGVSEGEAVDATVTLKGNTTADTTNAVAKKLNVFSYQISSDIPTPGELVLFQLNRNADHANDTLAEDAEVLMVRLRWKVG